MLEEDVGNNVTLAAIEESCITDVLREDDVVVGNSLALVTVIDDLCLAVEMKHKYRQVDHNTSSIPATTTLVLMQYCSPKTHIATIITPNMAYKSPQ